MSHAGHMRPLHHFLKTMRYRASTNAPTTAAETSSRGGSAIARGSSGEPTTGGTMIWMGHHELASLSPDDAGPQVHWVIVSQIHNSMLQLDPYFVLQPTLATGYEVTDDGLVYTFTLVEGAPFHVEITVRVGHAVADRIEQCEPLPRQQFVEQCLVRSEVRVQGALRDAALLRDPLHRGARVAVLLHDTQRGAHQRLLRLACVLLALSPSDRLLHRSPLYVADAPPRTEY